MEIDRKVDMGDSSQGQCCSTSKVSDRLNMGRSHDPSIVDGHVGKDPVEADVLLGMRVASDHGSDAQ
ncbi:hypothetical protein YTPLAS72_01820 [Nitrospira sp.]|nr:hypothetical protein YTPLAS72_01820 [Nitrospira sp.]